jgi:chaperonin GroES
LPGIITPAAADEALGLSRIVLRGNLNGLLACPRYEIECMTKSRKSFEYVEPIGARILVRKDEPKRESKGGIALPDQSEIPTITGRIVTISAQIEKDDDLPLRQYDKILFHPKNAIPVDFEPDNQLFVVPVEDVVAVFRREKPDEP